MHDDDIDLSDILESAGDVRQGATEVVGIDISERMIVCARQKSRTLNASPG